MPATGRDTTATPNYHSGDRCAEAAEALRACRLCEWRCGVNRLAGETGPCGLTDATHVFRCYVSYAEELELLPALMVYLGGCNFRCRFCTQAPNCFHVDQGPTLTSPAVLAQLTSAADCVPWINWVGGEPSLHPHALAKAREQIPPGAKWLLNTNAYFTPECFELLDGLIDLFLVDLKFGTDRCAYRLAGVPDYTRILQRNLLTIYHADPNRLLVRHLLMPGHEACCLRPVADWANRHLPGVRFHLMGSYVPAYRSMKDRAMSRTVPEADCVDAVRYCRKLGLNLVE